MRQLPRASTRKLQWPQDLTKLPYRSFALLALNKDRRSPKTFNSIGWQEQVGGNTQQQTLCSPGIYHGRNTQGTRGTRWATDETTSATFKNGRQAQGHVKRLRYRCRTHPPGATNMIFGREKLSVIRFGRRSQKIVTVATAFSTEKFRLS